MQSEARHEEKHQSEEALSIEWTRPLLSPSLIAIFLNYLVSITTSDQTIIGVVTLHLFSSLCSFSNLLHGIETSDFIVCFNAFISPMLPGMHAFYHFKLQFK